MIPVAEPLIGKEELDFITEAVKTGWISSQGKFITEFEKVFSDYCGMVHGIATSNGTTALHLALVALGIGKGDEVIVPDLTFIANANVVRYCGADPVFVDSTMENWCIDPAKIEEKITERTKAIIPVHVYGNPCDMGAIMKIAREHNLFVIEDCAEAHGAEYKGKRVGCFGDINCFSFFGNKIITTGEGGICLTGDEGLAEKMRILRDHGKTKGKQYIHDVVGFNYRMTNLQAAIGLGQMMKADELIKKKDEVKALYNSLLSSVEGITLPPAVSWARSVCWMYSVILKNGKRDDVMQFLGKKGIDSRPLLYPMHKQPVYKTAGEFPVSDYLSEHGITLPSSAKLTKNEIELVAKRLTEAVSAI